jgi:LemA protein
VLASSLVQDRLEGTGMLTTRTARDHVVLGYVARASDIDADVRREHPFAAYGELSFSVPVFTSGDVTARTLVRVEEARAPAQLIHQAVERMRGGPLAATLGTLPAFEPAWGMVEGWRGAIIHWVMADAAGLLYRVKIVDPSFLKWLPLSYALLKNIVPDFPLCTKSFNQSYSGNDLERRQGRYTQTMKTGLIVIGVIVLILVIGFASLFGVYNRFVTAEQGVNEKWAQVQNVYQRRADLIPNLVETVKGFAAQEKTVLEEVTRARASVGSIKATPELLNDPASFKRFQDAQNQLGGALSRLLVTVERYPELKSNQNFLALQSQLEGTENRITVERMRFNEAVRDYNTKIKLMPAALVARVMGFKEKAFFEAAPGSETVPKVKF